MLEEYKYLSALFYHTGIDNPSASSGGISYSVHPGSCPVATASKGNDEGRPRE
jgi:hypothetical protein